MKLRLSLILAVFLCLMVCCKKDKSPVSPTPQSFIYPTKIGNEWNYQRIFFLNFYQSDSTDFTNAPDTSFGNSVIKIAKEVILQDSIKVFQFKETLISKGKTYSNETYYSNQSDGFYRHGYKNPGYCIPKTSLSNKILFKGYIFNNVSEITEFFTRPFSLSKSNVDSLIIENPPVLTLVYPPELGFQWLVKDAGNPWRIDKKIIAKETVQVPAGKFVCYKIQHLHDLDGDSKWDEDLFLFDFVSSEGLVKRTAEFKNSKATNEIGEIIGSFDSIEEITLTNLKLK